MLEEQKNPYLIQIIKKMCSIIDVEYDSMDFQEPSWYEKHTWTLEQEDSFILWLAEELFANEAMRVELLENPEHKISNCFQAALHFVSSFGWITLQDMVDNIEENKLN